MAATELKVENPYVGPRPFEEQDRERFFGRDWEAGELVSLIVAHPAVLLYAQSGAGKTSLLNAKVIPLLRDEEGFEVLPVARVGGEIPKGVEVDQIANLFVFNTLLGWIESEADPIKIVSLPLPAFLKQLPRSSDEEGRPVLRVVVFDQFEELFTSYPEHWTEREGFFAQVRDALAEDPFLRVLFVLREEYLAQLEPYAELLPEHLRPRFRLERLRREAALVAVKGPLRGTGCSFAPGVAESLVEDLLAIWVETRAGRTVKVPGEFVEPVQLQVACWSLWEGLPRGVKQITQDHLRAFGNVNRALSEFYEKAIKTAAQRTGVKEDNLRAWFERELITPMGTRGTVYRGPQFTGGIPNVTVDILEDQHLIRAELRAGARWYELTHDRFIEPIQASNDAWRDARRQRRLRIAGGVVFIALVLFLSHLLLVRLTSMPRLQNGDFSKALSSWSRIPIYGYGPGEFKVEPTFDDFTHGMVLEFTRTTTRTDSEDPIGYASIAQKILPGPCQVTRVEMDVKVISHTLRNPGWWSCVHGGSFDYPVHIYLWSGDEIVWNWGFLTEDDGGAGCKAPNYTLIPENSWYSYDSGPLDVSGVTEVRVAGEGWNFHARVDNIKIQALPMPGNKGD